MSCKSSVAGFASFGEAADGGECACPDKSRLEREYAWSSVPSMIKTAKEGGLYGALYCGCQSDKPPCEQSGKAMEMSRECCDARNVASDDCSFRQVRGDVKGRFVLVNLSLCKQQ